MSFRPTGGHKRRRVDAAESSGAGAGASLWQEESMEAEEVTTTTAAEMDSLESNHIIAKVDSADIAQPEGGSIEAAAMAEDIGGCEPDTQLQQRNAAAAAAPEPMLCPTLVAGDLISLRHEGVRKMTLSPSVPLGVHVDDVLSVFSRDHSRSPENCHFYFNDQRLENDKTLAWYNILPGVYLKLM